MTALTAGDHIDIDALGVVVRIRLDDLSPADRARVEDAWSGARTLREDAPVATVSPRRHSPTDVTVADLTTRVTLAALAARRGRLWMVHAGALADAAGRVVLFSGRSGMGKTTLMTRLARDFAYVTDESVGVSDDGGVFAYRKPLSVIDDAARAKRQLSPGSLGLVELPRAPLRLHAIVVLERDVDRIDDSPAHLEPLDITEAVDAIAPQCSYLAELETPLQTMIGHIEEVGGALRLTYREASDAVPLVRALFDAPRPSPTPTARPVRISKPAPSTASPRARRSGFTRTPVRDAVTLEGGRLALLRGNTPAGTTVHVIDGVGPVLWHAAEGASLEELIAAAVRAHGAPIDVDAREAVEAALESLCRSGLIEGPTAASDEG